MWNSQLWKRRILRLFRTPTPLPERADAQTIHRRAPAGGLGGFGGGQFLPDALWRQERTRARADLPATLDRFGERFQLLRALYAQNAALVEANVTIVKLVPLTTIEAGIKTTVRDAYEEAFALGKRHAGNLLGVTDEDRKAIRKVRRDEFQYLRGFLRDMREQTGVMDYVLRGDYYRAAARELFWLGFVLSNQNAGRMIVWHTGRAEHCADCLRFAQHGPYSVEEFMRDVLRAGFLPQSGRLKCRGYNCKCWLDEEE
jgi:hypothetical protein